MEKPNIDIRQYAKKKGVNLWQISQRMEVHESTFYRHLRTELEAEKKDKIKQIIDELAD